MKDKYVLTAESVTEGHPDKLCDTIADAVVDACLEHDPTAHVACEVMATAGKNHRGWRDHGGTVPRHPCRHLPHRAGSRIWRQRL